MHTRIFAAVRCAPPDNKPTPQERDTCAPWLHRELAMVRPTLRVVIALGAFAWAAFCDDGKCEAEIKEALGVTTRNKPFEVNSPFQPGGEYSDRCIWCDQPATAVAIFARSY